jgi:cytoskeletal protein CcmA (bactofilin family)
MSGHRLDVNECEAFFTEGTELVGVLKTEGNVFLEGKMDGEIAATGKTVIEVDSVVNANINCHDINVNGEINGDLDIVNCIEVSSTGKVFGNLVCDELVIDEGATYRGEISVTEKNIKS